MTARQSRTARLTDINRRLDRLETRHAWAARETSDAYDAIRATTAERAAFMAAIDEFPEPVSLEGK